MADRPRRPLRLRTNPSRRYGFMPRAQEVRAWRRERPSVGERLRVERHKRAVAVFVRLHLLPSTPTPCPVCHWDTVAGHCIFEGHPSHFLAEAWAKVEAS